MKSLCGRGGGGCPPAPPAPLGQGCRTCYSNTNSSANRDLFSLGCFPLPILSRELAFLGHFSPGRCRSWLQDTCWLPSIHVRPLRRIRWAS